MRLLEVTAILEAQLAAAILAYDAGWVNSAPRLRPLVHRGPTVDVPDHLAASR